MRFIGIALSVTICVTVMTGVAHAACWKLPDGSIIETQSNSTPPVSKAKKVTCPKTMPAPSSAPTLSLLPISGRYPLDGRISQGYGDAWTGPGANPEKTHTGVDIAASKGTAVPSMTDGRVADIVAMGGGWGEAVIVEDAGGNARGYLHVKPSVKRGDKVVKGQEIGKVWSDHLHYNVCREVAYCHRGALPPSKEIRDRDPVTSARNDPLFPGPFKKP